MTRNMFRKTAIGTCLFEHLEGLQNSQQLLSLAWRRRVRWWKLSPPPIGSLRRKGKMCNY